MSGLRGYLSCATVRAFSLFSITRVAPGCKGLAMLQLHPRSTVLRWADSRCSANTSQMMDFTMPEQNAVGRAAAKALDFCHALH